MEREKVARQKLLKWPELQDEVCSYVRKWGLLAGAEKSLSIELSLDSINRALDPDSDLFIEVFYNAFRKALREYKTIHRHPKDDPEIQQDAYDQFRISIKAGRANVGNITYDEKGKAIKKSYQKPGLEKWQWDVLHPPQTFSEDSIVIVSANFYAMTLEDSSLTQEEKDKFIQHLAKLKRVSLEELQKRGFQPKH